MKILIVGATGMIGHRLWLGLSEKFDVEVIVRRPVESLPLLDRVDKSKVHFIDDVQDISELDRIIEKFYKELKISQNDKDNAKCGLRPVTPDGLPYIGRSRKYKNLTIATGHAMMGWSLGPATGKLVSQIISGKKTEMDITPFSPDRTF